jgi:hypothetical protein
MQKFLPESGLFQGDLKYLFPILCHSSINMERAKTNGPGYRPLFPVFQQNLSHLQQGLPGMPVNQCNFLL